jgi:hypothetical protein
MISSEEKHVRSLYSYAHRPRRDSEDSDAADKAEYVGPKQSYNDERGGFSVLSPYYDVDFGWTLAAAKFEAVRRSCEFGESSVEEMALYIRHGCNHEIWRALTVLVPHSKTQQALAYARRFLEEELTFEIPALCDCSECKEARIPRYRR